MVPNPHAAALAGWHPTPRPEEPMTEAICWQFAKVVHKTLEKGDMNRAFHALHQPDLQAAITLLPDALMRAWLFYLITRTDVVHHHELASTYHDYQSLDTKLSEIRAVEDRRWQVKGELLEKHNAIVAAVEAFDNENPGPTPLNVLIYRRNILRYQHDVVDEDLNLAEIAREATRKDLRDLQMAIIAVVKSIATR